MNLENEQNCMRVCYQHWKENNNKYLNVEHLSIITYAMLLEIINKSKNTTVNAEDCINKAKQVYEHGIENGWMMTH